jgi:hypothetical protein
VFYIDNWLNCANDDGSNIRGIIDSAEVDEELHKWIWDIFVNGKHNFRVFPLWQGVRFYSEMGVDILKIYDFWEELPEWVFNYQLKDITKPFNTWFSIPMEGMTLKWIDEIDRSYFSKSDDWLAKGTRNLPFLEFLNTFLYQLNDTDTDALINTFEHMANFTINGHPDDKSFSDIFVIINITRTIQHIFDTPNEDLINQTINFYKYIFHHNRFDVEHSLTDNILTVYLPMDFIYIKNARPDRGEINFRGLSAYNPYYKFEIRSLIVHTQDDSMDYW